MKELLVGEWRRAPWGTLEHQIRANRSFNQMLDELVETGYTEQNWAIGATCRLTRAARRGAGQRNNVVMLERMCGGDEESGDAQRRRGKGQ